MGFDDDRATLTMWMPKLPRLVDYHYMQPSTEGAKWVTSIFAYEREEGCGAPDCDRSKIKLLFRFEVILPLESTTYVAA